MTNTNQSVDRLIQELGEVGLSGKIGESGDPSHGKFGFRTGFGALTAVWFKAVWLTDKDKMIAQWDLFSPP